MTSCTMEGLESHAKEFELHYIGYEESLKTVWWESKGLYRAVIT